MKTQNAVILALTLTAPLLLTACGGTPYSVRSTQTGLGASSNYFGTTTTTPTPTPTTTPTPTPTSTPIVVNTTGLPPYEFQIEGTGYTSYTFTVKANKVLKVKFKPGINNKAISGTNFTPIYSQLGVWFQVGNTSKATEMLDNGYYSGRAMTSTVIDFSADVVVTGSADTDRHDVTITIYKPNNNFYCLFNGTGCPWTQVVSTHPWNGLVTVQTDDTNPI